MGRDERYSTDNTTFDLLQNGHVVELEATAIKRYNTTPHQHNGNHAHIALTSVP